MNIKDIIDDHNTKGEMGRFTEAGAAANMVEDVWQHLKKTGPVTNERMETELNKLQKELKQYGVTELEIIDTNHDGKVNLGDKIHVRSKELVKVDHGAYVGNVEHNLALGSKHQETPAHSPEHREAPKPANQHKQESTSQQAKAPEGYTPKALTEQILINDPLKGDPDKAYEEIRKKQDAQPPSTLEKILNKLGGK